MNTRIKLVAALGLALATGFAGVASAQTASPSTQTPAMSQTDAAPAATPASAIVKTPSKAVMTKKAVSHRTHVTHRAMKHRKVAGRQLRRTRTAHKVGTTVPTKTAKSSLARKAVAKIQASRTKHAMNRPAKPTVIR